MWKSKHLHKRQKTLALLLIPFLLIIAIYTVVSYWENRAYNTSLDEVNQYNNFPNEPRTVVIDGKTYVSRDDIESILFLGIDSTMEKRDSAKSYGGGQADVILLLVIDHQAQSYSILQINRDTVMDIPVLGVLGNQVGTREAQICLSYAYGDGRKQSCKNTATALSEFLWDQPIEKYGSLLIEGIAVLTDAVGGVKVFVEEDFSTIDNSIIKGESIVLTGQTAVTYLRARHGVDDETNISRMQRHRKYINALLERIAEKSKNEIISIYNSLDKYISTNIGTRTVSKVSEYINEYSFAGIITMDGVSETGNDGTNRFIVDEQSRQNVILELFYREET